MCLLDWILQAGYKSQICSPLVKSCSLLSLQNDYCFLTEVTIRVFRARVSSSAFLKLLDFLLKRMAAWSACFCTGNEKLAVMLPPFELQESYECDQLLSGTFVQLKPKLGTSKPAVRCISICMPNNPLRALQKKVTKHEKRADRFWSQMRGFGLTKC